KILARAFAQHIGQNAKVEIVVDCLAKYLLQVFRGAFGVGAGWGLSSGRSFANLFGSAVGKAQHQCAEVLFHLWRFGQLRQKFLFAVFLWGKRKGSLAFEDGAGKPAIHRGVKVKAPGLEMEDGAFAIERQILDGDAIPRRQVGAQVSVGLVGVGWSSRASGCDRRSGGLRKGAGRPEQGGEENNS